MVLPGKPEDWPRVFEKHLNAGDLDSVMELYEAGARFVTAAGKTVAGRHRIRELLSGMIRAQTRLQSHVQRAVTVDDIALLHTDFRGTTLDESGNRVGVLHRAVEVLRRQLDGAWKLIVGDPGGRQSGPAAPGS